MIEETTKKPETKEEHAAARNSNPDSWAEAFEPWLKPRQNEVSVTENGPVPATTPERQPAASPLLEELEPWLSGSPSETSLKEGEKLTRCRTVREVVEQLKRRSKVRTAYP